jgi:GNAT superfamily N-acetyltransferase
MARLTVHYLDNDVERHAAAAAALIAEYADGAMALEEFLGEAPAFHAIEMERLGSFAGYHPPAGRFLVVYVANAPAGCAAVVRRDVDVAELRRVFVRPSYRGAGLGGALVTAAIRAARELGYRSLYLESHRSMEAAHRRYAAAGFVRVPPMSDYPDYLREVAVCMALQLDVAASPTSRT